MIAIWCSSEQAYVEKTGGREGKWKQKNVMLVISILMTGIYNLFVVRLFCYFFLAISCWTLWKMLPIFFLFCFLHSSVACLLVMELGFSLIQFMDRYFRNSLFPLLSRWIQDSLDQYTKERLEAINDEFKLYRCHNIQNCVHACPKGLNPAKQINSLKKPQLQ